MPRGRALRRSTLAVELDPNWPGTQAPADREIVDQDAVLAFADRLEHEAQFLSQPSPGTPARLQVDTRMPSGAVWFGRWATARDMEHGYATASAYVAHFYQELVAQLHAVAAAARAAVTATAAADVAASASLVPPADDPGRTAVA